MVVRYKNLFYHKISIKVSLWIFRWQTSAMILFYLFDVASKCISFFKYIQTHLRSKTSIFLFLD